MALLTLLPAPDALANRGSPVRPITEKDFDVKSFSGRSINIDNRFLPLAPGTTFTLTGTANRGGTGGRHDAVFTVTDVTKWVNGVRTLVMWDRDFQDGELVEEELAFMAQDDFGNVWSLGEYPEEHEDGTVTAPRTWLAGRQGAKAGVLMRANPRTHTSTYLQGLAPAVEFIDKAKVFKTGQKACVPTGCYGGVLVVDEWDPSAQPQDGHQFKYHAPGVGVVQIVGKGGDEQETLALTKRRMLTDKELDAARSRALQLDKRAYRLAAEAYRGTPFASVRKD